MLQIISSDFRHQLSFAIFVAFISLTLPLSSLKASELSLSAEDWTLLRLAEYKNQVRRRIGGDYIVSINSLRNKFLETYDQSDFEGDGLSAEDFKISEQQKKQRIYAFKIQSWLMKDLNRDFIVTKKELKIFYHKQASRSLRSGHTFIRKTKEQIEQALNDMILRDLVMDKNGDDTISFSEVKNYTEKNANKKRFNNRYGRLNRYNQLYNRQIPFSFDTNNNGIIEKGEYLKIIDQTIALYNKDKNSILSPQEQAEIDTKKKSLYRSRNSQKFWKKPLQKNLKENDLTKEI